MKTSRDTKWRFVERIHRVIASNFVQSCEIARFHRGTIIQSRFWSRLILLNLIADKADYDNNKNPVRFTIAGRNCAYSQKRSRFSCFSIFYLILYNVTWKLYIYIYEKLYIYIMKNTFTIVVRCFDIIGLYIWIQWETKSKNQSQRIL